MKYNDGTVAAWYPALLFTVPDMPISFERSFSLHDDALLLRGQRASVLASNIANADTPNYKARDFDFADAMQKAGDSMTPSVTLASTHRNHITPDSGGQFAAQSAPALQYRVPLHPSLDGNTVDSHVEQAEFARNAMQYQASFTFLNSKINGLVKALKGE